MKISTVRLTPNEADILDRLARGEDVAAIANNWGTSRAVVYRHFDRARKVMGARTPYEAVALWVRRQEARGPSRAPNGRRSLAGAEAPVERDSSPYTQ